MSSPYGCWIRQEDMAMNVSDASARADKKSSPFFTWAVLPFGPKKQR